MQISRMWAWVMVIVATLATASPLVPQLRGHKGDSFPLSWFPMFAKERPAVESPTYVVGTTESGDRVKVDVSFWTSGGFNQGRNMLTTEVKRKRADAMCATIAKSVARRGRGVHKRVVELWIVRGTYDRARFFGGDEAPITEKLIARCPVNR